MSNPNDLLATTDAMVWAEEFIGIIRNRGEYPGADPLDPGFMVAWFANAIETGRAHPHPTPEPNINREAFTDADTPREVLGILAGASSVCWNPRPTGVFDSSEAEAFVDLALRRLIELGWATKRFQLEHPAVLRGDLAIACAALNRAHGAASESDGERTGLTGPVRDVIFGINTAVAALASMIDVDDA